MESNCTPNNKILFKDECYKIQGAIFEVYKHMGCGFLESVYQECLETEFRVQEIPFESQAAIPVFYKGVSLNQGFRADFICFNEIIIEIKAGKMVDPIHKAQIINYLKATGKRVGLLVYFGTSPKAVIERVVQ